MRNRLLAAAAFLLAGLVFWAPIPFASVTPRGLLALELGGLAAAVLTFAAGGRHGARKVALPAAALGCLALLGVLQAAPLPAALAGMISPEHRRLAAGAAEALGEAPPAAVRLSLAPGLSLRTALWMAVLALALIGSALAFRERRHRRVLGGALLAAGIFECLYGIRFWLADTYAIWGTPVPGVGDRLRGTYVNPNHLAYFLAVVLAAVFAWGWWTARRAMERPDWEVRIALMAPPLLLWLVLFVVLSFTGSRGGLVAVLAATVAQGVLLAGRRWWLASLGALAGIAGVGVLAASGLQRGIGRLAATTPYEIAFGNRRMVYESTLGLWLRFPLTGSGLGTFRDAFPLEQPRELAGIWRHAHCDWLEVLATTGVVGLALVLVGLGALALRLLKVVREGRRTESRAAGLAALGALVAAGVHSAVDFGVTMPANAFVLVVVVGAGAAARTGERKRRSGQKEKREGEGEPGDDEPSRSSGRRRSRRR